MIFSPSPSTSFQETRESRLAEMFTVSGTDYYGTIHQLTVNA